jgi:hypothetical protein
MTTTTSEAKIALALAGFNLAVAATVEALTLIVFHQTGLIPTVISVIVCAYLVLFSSIVTARRLANHMSDLNDDLHILSGQEEMLLIKHKQFVRRTIEDIVQELRGY